MADEVHEETVSQLLSETAEPLRRMGDAETTAASGMPALELELRLGMTGLFPSRSAASGMPALFRKDDACPMPPMPVDGTWW